ncbi:5470_t:CDS:2 [Funneliformis mosseae]|uniref:5470_t:CDS:1 n=1 Tax=Funneliformis mosseae TaxID=27381 RepID=A0A9N9B4Q2_FUNMO|nr:5470_t:CDS:2 [Funneliformis mosseae]
MDVNSHENETQIDKFNVPVTKCSYCGKPFAVKLWCKECDPWSYRCMDANTNKRPTCDELLRILNFWNESIFNYEKYKYIKHYGKEIKEAFEEADKEISNILILRTTNPDAVYKSRAFSFKNMTKPINSSFITSYLEKDEDSQLHELEISAHYNKDVG